MDDNRVAGHEANACWCVVKFKTVELLRAGVGQCHVIKQDSGIS